MPMEFASWLSSELSYVLVKTIRWLKTQMKNQDYLLVEILIEKMIKD